MISCTFLWIKTSDDPANEERHGCNVVPYNDDKGRGLRIVACPNSSWKGKIVRPASRRLMNNRMFDAVYSQLANAGETSV